MAMMESDMQELGFTTKLTNVGMLRQWLNEDRITDPTKMVTNEDIIHFLMLDYSKYE